MPVSLEKGESIPLGSDLKNIKVCLGWGGHTIREDFDLDLSCFMLGADEKVLRDHDFIFYGNTRSKCGSVQHRGDDRKGGIGDVERISANLVKVPKDYVKLVFTVTIYKFDKRKQNFGMIPNVFVRLINRGDGENVREEEIARYEISKSTGNETALLFAEIYRYNGRWKFKALGEQYCCGLLEFCQRYGVNVQS